MVRSLAALGFLALALAASAGAAPQRDALIRPGVGIGKVRLGMSLEQVRAAWGRPQSVVQSRHGRGPRRLELQYDFAAYTVVLEGSAGRERVVSVGTTLAKERTSQGLGVGSAERRLQRLLRGRLRCDQLDTFIQPRTTIPLIQTNHRECTLGDRGEPQTVFASKMRLPSFLPEDWSERAYVYEVIVRAPTA